MPNDIDAAPEPVMPIIDDSDRIATLERQLTQARQELAETRQKALEEAAAICDAQSRELECPERATYCAEAIRELKKRA